MKIKEKFIFKKNLSLKKEEEIKIDNLDSDTIEEIKPKTNKRYTVLYCTYVWRWGREKN